MNKSSIALFILFLVLTGCSNARHASRKLDGEPRSRFKEEFIVNQWIGMDNSGGGDVYRIEFYDSHTGLIARTFGDDLLLYKIDKWGVTGSNKLEICIGKCLNPPENMDGYVQLSCGTGFGGDETQITIPIQGIFFETAEYIEFHPANWLDKKLIEMKSELDKYNGEQNR